jgi:nucleoside-diphosphate kinase
MENKGFVLIGLKMVKPSKELASEHLKHWSVRNKRYYHKIVDYLHTKGPVVAMVWQGSILNYCKARV